MIVTLTGTPGTGKTSVAEHLGYETIDLTEFVKKHGLGKERDEFEVDIDAMVEKLEEEIDPEKDTVIEGHLSHHFSSDYCVVLRCEPDELEDRLSEREYSKEKIRENMDSETLDVILTEALSTQGRIIEIDTTGREAEEVAGEIEKRIENGETGYGEIDWTDRI